MINDSQSILLAEVDRIQNAIDKLAEIPDEVVGAALLGMNSTSIDAVANASDEALEEFDFGTNAAIALRFMCRLALTMRQAKRLAEVFKQ
jgi:hypothetical protein